MSLNSVRLQTFRSKPRSLNEWVRDEGDALRLVYGNVRRLMVENTFDWLTGIEGRTGFGKALPFDEPVLTPYGSVPIGKLGVGDLVTGSNGQGTRVTHVTPQGLKDVFEVSFSTGETARCASDHLWTVRTNHGNVKTIPLHEMISSGFTVKSQGAKSAAHGTRPKYHVPLLRPIEYTLGPALPMDAYLLGLLLGDGKLGDGNVTFHKDEKDIMRRLLAALPEEDVGVVYEDSGGHLAIRIKRRVKDNDVSQTRRIIDGLGLRTDSFGKFIPDIYQTASLRDRWALLRGLFDTDGSVVKERRAQVEYSTSSPRLGEDIARLARGLGALVRVTKRVTEFRDAHGRRVEGAPSYCVSVRFPHDTEKPVSSRKHLRRWREPRVHPIRRSIVGARFVGREECVCIGVEAPDGLFAIREGILTHNSTLAKKVANASLRAGGVLRTTSDMLELLQFLVAAEPGDVCIYDEGANGMFSRQATSIENQAFVLAIMTARAKRVHLVIIIPNREWFDIYLRGDSVRFFWHVKSLGVADLYAVTGPPKWPGDKGRRLFTHHFEDMTEEEKAGYLPQKMAFIDKMLLAQIDRIMKKRDPDHETMKTDAEVAGLQEDIKVQIAADRAEKQASAYSTSKNPEKLAKMVAANRIEPWSCEVPKCGYGPTTWKPSMVKHLVWHRDHGNHAQPPSSARARVKAQEANARRHARQSDGLPYGAPGGPRSAAEARPEE